jgi:hypothetical protein
MCTVTIVPLRLDTGAIGFRLASNRDELRTRPPARAPEIRAIGPRLAAMPIDPQGGGTWIGVNDAGVAMTLLNAGDGEQEFSGESARSRGLVIPSLLACASSLAARRSLQGLDTGAYRSFRLVVTDGTDTFEARWNRETLTIHDEPSLRRHALFFTSSSLGDGLVHGPRRALFEEWLEDVKPDDDPASIADRQNGFHRHRWSDRPELSVSMSRSDARTVSFTIVELREDRALMIYRGTPDDPAPASTISVTLRREPPG